MSYDHQYIVSSITIEIGDNSYPVANKDEIDLRIFASGVILNILNLGILEVIGMYSVPGFDKWGEYVHEVSILCSPIGNGGDL